MGAVEIAVACVVLAIVALAVTLITLKDYTDQEK